MMELGWSVPRPAALKLDFSRLASVFDRDPRFRVEGVAHGMVLWAAAPAVLAAVPAVPAV